MLLAGKPALHIPIFMEQAVNAKAAERLGAAICVPPSEPKQIANALAALLSTDRYAKAARAFADRYRDFNPDLQIEQMIERAEGLAIGSKSSA
jgi:UDP:flavonoid glycosyltransferase YjiC (YdhE family)